MKRFKMFLGVLVCTALLATLGTTPPAMAGGGGEECVGDADGDGQTGVLDFLAVLAAFGEDCSKEPCSEDVNGDGVVDILDLLQVLADFGCGATECESNADCDDGDDCTVDLCIGGNCFNVPIPDCGG